MRKFDYRTFVRCVVCGGNRLSKAADPVKTDPNPGAKPGRQY
jgi:hypothetical protein